MRKTETCGVLSGVLGVMALAMAAAPTHADTVIYQNNFDTNTTGVALVAGSGNTAANTGTESTFTQNSPGASLHLVDNSTASNPSATVTFAVAAGEASTPLVISFDYLKASTVQGENSGVFIGGPESVRGVNLILSNGGAGNIQYNAGGTTQWVDTGTQLQGGVWYHVTLTLQPAATNPDSWDLHIVNGDGTQDYTLANLAFQNQLSAFTTVQFQSNTAVSGTGSDFSIDNLVIQTVTPTSIPTPAALPAGAGLLLAMVASRRRTR